MSDKPDAIEPLIEGLLKEIGEDLSRDGLTRTEGSSTQRAVRLNFNFSETS